MENLNKKQLLAVKTIDGPLQILAGAGSGKTKVIINRISNIINTTDSTDRILALTFTNKAANEMKTRLSLLLNKNVNNMWIGTFHSICLRILRVHIDKIGYSRDFVIYDRYDQQTLVKECCKELNINTDRIKPIHFLSSISSAKDELISPSEYKKEFAIDLRTINISNVYNLYQEKLHKNNALDFDDIIFLTIKLLKENKEVLAFYQDKFKYIMVDEYQDTNHSQYILINLLAQKYRNICVVGDDDQAIYGWRGADIRNILDFSNDYSDSKIIKLEQNYRSTQTILDASNAVIEKNLGRNEKKLWTNKNTDEKIILINAYDERDEAKKVIQKVKSLKESFKNNDIAILYRANSQSRAIEEELINAKIPYKIFGGLKFYDRKEIKDILAYLRLISNVNDDVALKRIINVPKRGIGSSSLEKIEHYANLNGISLFSALIKYNEIALSTKIKNSILDFLNIVDDLITKSKTENICNLIDLIINNTNYIEELKNEGEIEFETRMDNISELKSVSIEFEKSSEDKLLSKFLSDLALTSDVDEFEEKDNVVTLMTLHSSKGLEFPVVFIVGMEEGIFPSAKSIMTEEQIEEERRLCYVGMTRAKDRLFLSYANSRNYYGKLSKQIVSRFIKDIPKQLIEGSIKREVTQGYSLIDKYRKKREMIAQIPKENKNRFDLGDTVIHPAFGSGKIVAKTDSMYTVIFGKAGIKKIAINFENLKRG